MYAFILHNLLIFEPLPDKWKKGIIANGNGLDADDELNLPIGRSGRGDERRKQLFNYLLEIRVRISTLHKLFVRTQFHRSRRLTTGFWDTNKKYCLDAATKNTPSCVDFVAGTQVFSTNHVKQNSVLLLLSELATTTVGMSENSFRASVFLCASATGEKLIPFVVFAGTRDAQVHQELMANRN
ncbi:hypothetical protein PHMEG_000372 [Phytophthora megakarya]|uniref:Uncharacterized protein n=1 Tax=Phytophthora megakarya TaxID=4795 RepID=A0A225X3S8_9STRA|nr:hypothetical protein PHMEG_000372 [Phytophthora megakarya]